MHVNTIMCVLGLGQIAVRRSPQLIPTPARGMIRRTFRPTALSGSRGEASTSEIPRAAVSTVVQCRIEKSTALSASGTAPFHKYYYYYYLLVQRGKEPNMGMWSLPGGKLEWGEPTLAGAQRELDEETTWPNDGLKASLQWYNGTLCATESIGEGYHYLIAQCFAQLTIPSGTGADAPPLLGAADDAAAVGWFTRDALKDELRDVTTPGVLLVIDRAEELSRKGLLPVN
jgi:ADP-ribose pyrophosphatase YjhB (NUDIX family)